MNYDQAGTIADRLWGAEMMTDTQTYWLQRISRSPEAFEVRPIARRTGKQVAGTVHSFDGKGFITCHPACQRRAIELNMAELVAEVLATTPKRSTRRRSSTSRSM